MMRTKRAFYEKLPIQVVAFQWRGHDPIEPEDRLVRYFRRPGVKGSSNCKECQQTFHVHGWIDTKEGGHIVCPDDFIIEGIAGEVYPCKPNIFNATYKKVKI